MSGKQFQHQDTIGLDQMGDPSGQPQQGWRGNDRQPQAGDEGEDMSPRAQYKRFDLVDGERQTLG
jgi:hypothetical protein